MWGTAFENLKGYCLLKQTVNGSKENGLKADVIMKLQVNQIMILPWKFYLEGASQCKSVCLLISSHIFYIVLKKKWKSQILKRKRAVHTTYMELEKLWKFDGKIAKTTLKNGNNFIPKKTNKVILTNFLPMFLFTPPESIRKPKLSWAFQGV